MAEDAPVSLSAGGRHICSVCCQAVAAYTCPRCHKAYCTSACYKQHGHQCTEAFYREQATSQMKATRADAAQTQQMMRILQRMHEQGGLEQQQQQHGDSSSAGSSDAGSEDGSEAEDEGEAAAAAGLDRWLAQSPEFQQLLQRAAAQGDVFEVLPSDLSAELADRLDALALSGRLSHLLSPWKPWWAHPAAADISLSASGQRVIAELHSNSSISSAAAPAQASNGSSSSPERSASNALGIDSEGFAPVPEPPDQPLPSLVQLAGPRFRPSPLLPYELLQLLVAYCAVMHYWNGEPDCGGGSSSGSSSEQGWEAAEQLMLLAPPLEQQAARLASSGEVQQAQQISTEQGEDKASSQQQQQQQLVPEVADSVRCACMQLAEAAAALHGELRALLQQATADALALLQLGRSAVLLALTDSCWLLERGRRNLKQQRQQQKQQQRGKGSDASSRYSLQQNSQQQVQLEQQVLLEQQLKLACRKLVFFQVWCNEQGPAVFEQLSLQLAVELREKQAISTPAAAGVKLGVQPVELPRKQQQQQRAAQVMQEAVQVVSGEDVQGPALAAANGQHHQQQQQTDGYVQPVSAQAADNCMQPGGRQHEQQKQQQQQLLSSHVSAGGGSAPVSDLYELD